MNHLQLHQAGLPDLSANQISRLPKDQLAQHCHIVETGNESYRFRNSSTQTSKEVKQRKFKQEP